MASERVGDMTKAEFETWVMQLIERHLRWAPDETPDKRTPMEVFESMRQNILKRKPEQASIVEMVREDREH